MAQIVIVARTGAEHVIDAREGSTLMEAIRDAGLDELLALCGGVCSCATCHVHVDPSWGMALPPMGEDENDLLDGSAHRDATSRLSCQIRIAEGLDGLKARIAAED